MSRKEWMAVALVIGVGIVWQIPRHDEAMPTNAADHAHAPAETVGAALEEAAAAAAVTFDTTATSASAIIAEVERVTGFGVAMREADAAIRR